MSRRKCSKKEFGDSDNGADGVLDHNAMVEVWRSDASWQELRRTRLSAVVILVHSSSERKRRTTLKLQH
jgi:hypothetical protein